MTTLNPKVQKSKSASPFAHMEQKKRSERESKINNKYERCFKSK